MATPLPSLPPQRDSRSHTARPSSSLATTQVPSNHTQTARPHNPTWSAYQEHLAKRERLALQRAERERLYFEEQQRAKRQARKREKAERLAREEAQRQKTVARKDTQPDQSPYQRAQAERKKQKDQLHRAQLLAHQARAEERTRLAYERAWNTMPTSSTKKASGAAKSGVNNNAATSTSSKPQKTSSSTSMSDTKRVPASSHATRPTSITTSNPLPQTHPAGPSASASTTAANNVSLHKPSEPSLQQPDQLSSSSNHWKDTARTPRPSLSPDPFGPDYAERPSWNGRDSDDDNGTNSSPPTSPYPGPSQSNSPPKKSEGVEPTAVSTFHPHTQLSHPDALSASPAAPLLEQFRNTLSRFARWFHAANQHQDVDVKHDFMAWAKVELDNLERLGKSVPPGPLSSQMYNEYLQLKATLPNDQVTAFREFLRTQQSATSHPASQVSPTPALNAVSTAPILSPYPATSTARGALAYEPPSSQYGLPIQGVSHFNAVALPPPPASIDVQINMADTQTPGIFAPAHSNQVHGYPTYSALNSAAGPVYPSAPNTKTNASATSKYTSTSKPANPPNFVPVKDEPLSRSFDYDSKYTATSPYALSGPSTYSSSVYDGTCLPHPSTTDHIIKQDLSDPYLSVYDDLTRDIDVGQKGAMAKIFENDKEAVAEMADLAQCSPEALQQLQERGLTTPLKPHQSSALRFLVEAEHRRVPQVPSDDEVCLWRATRHYRRIVWVNRVDQARVYVQPEMPRGAILADDMGLGKTLTILSLIVSPEDGGIIVEHRNKLPMPKKPAADKSKSAQSKSKDKGKAADDKGKTADVVNKSERHSNILTEIKDEERAKKTIIKSEPAPPPAMPNVATEPSKRPKPTSTASWKAARKREASGEVVVLDGPPTAKKVKQEVIDLAEVEPATVKPAKKEVVDLSDDDSDKDLWDQFDDDAGFSEIDEEQFLANITCATPAKSTDKGQVKEQPIVVQDDDDSLWAQMDLDDGDFEILNTVLSSQPAKSVKAEQSSQTPLPPQVSVKSEVTQDEGDSTTHSKVDARVSPPPTLAAGEAPETKASVPASSKHRSASPLDEDVPKARPRPSNPTLIICPLSVLTNWTSQADAHITNPRLKYGVMHGKEAQALRNYPDWRDYDFILTTYDSLKAARRRLAMLAMHEIRVMKVTNNVDTCEEDLDRAEELLRSAPTWNRPSFEANVARCKEALVAARDRQANYSILPPQKGGNSEHDPVKGKACKERAERVRARNGNSDEFTDDQLYYIWTGHTERPAGERLFEQDWLRVILDEAHVIRNPGTQVFEAVHALHAERRVAVTGTPIVNSTKDLGSLASWIGVEPFADQVAGPRLWKQSVEDGLATGDGNAVRILRSITKALVILRTKEMEVDGKPLVELPEITSYTYEVHLHADDAALYRQAESKLREKLIEWAEDGILQKKKANILVILQRLRQLANDRRLIPGDLLQMIGGAEDVGDEAAAATATVDTLTAAQIKTLQQVLQAKVEDGDTCRICNESLVFVREEPDPSVMGACGHAFHTSCITQRLQQTNGACPIDGRAIGSVSKLIKLPQAEEITTPTGDGTERDSAKIDAVSKIVGDAYAANANDKTIIFSNFVGLLKLIEARMERDGVPYATLYGSHTKSQREITLASFNRPLGLSSSTLDTCATPLTKKLPPTIPRVILMSMGAGSVGLNLTVANHVILVDPWWNEAMQLQAINRAHRIGQTKPVNVHRLVSRETVEIRVVEIANEKVELATFALSGVKHKGQSVYNGLAKNTMRNIGALVGMDLAQRARFAAAARNN